MLTLRLGLGVSQPDSYGHPSNSERQVTVTLQVRQGQNPGVRRKLRLRVTGPWMAARP